MVMGLLKARQIYPERACDATRGVAIFTNCLSLAHASYAGRVRSAEEPEVLKALNSVAELAKVTVYNAKGHCGVRQNEEVDKLAGCAARKVQAD